MGWYNSDGLYLPFATEEATAGIGGETSVTGDRRELVFTISNATMIALSATAGSTILGDNIWLPKNARLEEVEVEVITACAGANAALNIGLVRSDARSTSPTELDYEALVKAAAVTTLDSAGKRLNLIKGSTAAGDLLGTTLSYNGLLTADYDTAAFTAGELRVRVRYFFL